jgi:hypothetical protein
MDNTMVHLIGPPGAGKFTIATHLARLTGARLVDNHSINNVLFNPIALDGVTPLPGAIWPLVRRLREVVFETIATVSPPGLSFVFTNYLHHEDHDALRANLDLAAARGATYVPVMIICRTDELLRRIVTEDRRTRLKLVDPVAGRRLNEDVPLIAFEHPNMLTLDVTNLAPERAARLIAGWVEQCCVGRGRSRSGA